MFSLTHRAAVRGGSSENANFAVSSRTQQLCRCAEFNLFAYSSSLRLESLYAYPYPERGFPSHEPPPSARLAGPNLGGTKLKTTLHQSLRCYHLHRSFNSRTFPLSTRETMAGSSSFAFKWSVCLLGLALLASLYSWADSVKVGITSNSLF
jgi:hypothetical protein